MMLRLRRRKPEQFELSICDAASGDDPPYFFVSAFMFEL
jgi:hypothetical protein